MSLPAWLAWLVCVGAVGIHWWQTGHHGFLLWAVPGLLLMMAIPMALNRMSRKTYAHAEADYRRQARKVAIGRISSSMLGEPVALSGTVRKVSFQWLNRPHFQVSDETGTIRVMSFTSLPSAVRRGDFVEVLGTVMKNVFDKRRPAVSAVSIRPVKHASS